MADTRTVAVRLKADVTSYTTSMKQASQSTANFDKQQAASQSRAAKWKAVGLASQIGGAALAAGLLAATKAASDQEQAMGALSSVFKVNGAQMTANAEGAAQMGLSTTDYANAAAKLGAQLSNLGVSQADLGGTTDDLITKAGDLAAQFGGTTQEAVDALGAAMRGEADPAERYGLALNATAVNAEMAATGADKAGAMMALLNKQMAKSGAVGAMGREFNTAASATQRAKAEFENASASLGEALLPAMAKAAEAASGLLGKFNDMSDGAKTATTYVAATGAAALVAGPKIVEMALALKKLKDEGSALGALATKGAALGGVVLGAEAFLTALTAITDKAGAVTGLVNEFAALKDTVVSLTPGLGPLIQLGETLSDVIGRSRVLGDSNNLLGAAWNSLTGETEDNTEAVDASADAQKALGSTLGGVAGSLLDVKAAAQEQERTLDKLRATLGDVISLNRALIGDEDALLGQEKRLEKARKANGASLTANTKAAAANREAMGLEVDNITALAKSTYDRIAATGDEERAQRAANRVISEHVRELQKAAIAAGYSKTEVNAYIERLGFIPGAVPVKFTTTGLGDANTSAATLQTTLAGITGDYVARLMANPVGDPVGNANAVKASAGSIVGDYTARLLANKVSNPEQSARDVGSAAGTMAGDYTARLLANKVSEPEKAANDVGTAAGKVAGNFVANLMANKVSKPVEAANEVGNAVGKVAGNYVATISVSAVNSASQAYTIGSAIGSAIGRGIADHSGGKNKKKAAGGPIRGPGSGTSDTAGLFALSNGEYVVRERAARKIGLANMNQINQGNLPTARGYAAGGIVSTARPAPATTGGGFSVTSVPVIVQIDSRAIATGQLKLQRQSGGTVTVGG